MGKMCNCKEITSCSECCFFGGSPENSSGNIPYFVCTQGKKTMVFILISGSYIFDTSWDIYTRLGFDYEDDVVGKCKLKDY